MAEKQLISTIKNVAASKSAFFLSEVLPYLDEPVGIHELFCIISPKLPALGLAAKKIEGDFEISRIRPAQAFLLTHEESKRQETFLAERSIPDILSQSIEAYITKKVGKEWSDPVILERLRRAIVAQKDDYWNRSQKGSLQYTKGYSVLGYLAYHFPVYFMQTEHLLKMLADNGLLKKNMNILDVGTGPGVVPLAIADFYSRLDDARATIWSLERFEEHIEAFIYLRNACVPPGGKVSIRPPFNADIRDIDHVALPDAFDVITLSNVLNELVDRTPGEQAEIVTQLSERLAPDGSLLIVEPADRENAIRMRTLTITLLKKELSLFGPCSFLWGSTCTAPRCWSFETAPAIKPLRLMETLANCEESYRYVNTDIKYSYSILRKDTLKQKSYHLAPGSRFLRFSKLHLHIGKRINVAGIKMSAELGDARSHVFKLCDGTAKKPVYAALPSYHITRENDSIICAPYGSILELRNTLVRYNRQYDAYNLLVNRNTQIEVKNF
ncbi:MAG: small ribosomal subunit Rsm22 family protein [Halobacteriota archaeon]